MASLHLRNLLRSDQKQITPSEQLQDSIAAQFTESAPAPFSWRLFATIGTSAVLCASFALVVVVEAPRHPTSFLAQAHAAYDTIHSQLAEPGSVRHIVMQITTMQQDLFVVKGGITFQPDVPLEEKNIFTSETWSKGDGSAYLVGTPDGLTTLATPEGSYVPSSYYDAFLGDRIDASEGAIITDAGNGDLGPRYTMMLPEQAASFQAWVDPADAGTECVDVQMLTPKQQQAKSLLKEISSTQQAMEKGAATPDDLLALIERTPGIQDRGMVTDSIVGQVQVYRVAYEVVGESPDIAESFIDFGFSTDTHLLRLQTNGSISHDDKEEISSETRTLIDEVIPASEVASDFFSPERIGFVKIPPADTDNPETFPVFFLQNGCYRQGIDAPTWLPQEEESAARARIAALGDAAGSMGGGGF